jgi:uncharacterized 2Fe-2S/4Fe-4S cluster protein (DUF4445 family)
MLALLTQSDPQQLLQPDNWTRPIYFKLEQRGTWVNALGLHPQATVEVVPPLAGFVGSDLLAGVLATGLTRQPGALLIDFGTNCEMAFWDGHTLRVTSAAGGPAFEGCGIQCGMPAEPGAIYRFGPPSPPLSNPLSPPHHAPPIQDGRDALHRVPNFEVLGGIEPKGFCGSGLVDLIAWLRDTGDLTPTGSFPKPQHKDRYVLLERDSVIRLTKRDVDTLQRAKAAVGAGIRTLLARTPADAPVLNRICVCGVFGQHLNIRNAQRIGLLPDIPPEHIELCGNTALAGCERLLLSASAAAELLSLRKRAAIINLSQTADFDALFLENLYLQPLKVE